MIVEQRYMTKRWNSTLRTAALTARDVYYHDTKLFGNQTSSDRILEELATITQLFRNDLRIVRTWISSLVLTDIYPFRYPLEGVE